MKNLILILVLFISLVGSSQTNKSQYKATLHFSNGKDSVVYFKSKEEMMKYYGNHKKKRDEFVSKPKKVYSKTLDMNLVEQEFYKLFLNYQDSVFHVKKEYGNFLDSLSYCQLKYLTNLDSNYISHEQKNVKFKTLTDRWDYYYVDTNESYGEILSLINGGENEIEVAKHFFNNWLKSKGHKVLIDRKNYRFYNFKFGYNKFDRIVGVGVFSNDRQFLK
jgi:hypothetical protein